MPLRAVELERRPGLHPGVSGTSAGAARPRAVGGHRASHHARASSSGDAHHFVADWHTGPSLPPVRTSAGTGEKLSSIVGCASPGRSSNTPEAEHAHNSDCGLRLACLCVSSDPSFVVLNQEHYVSARFVFVQTSMNGSIMTIVGTLVLIFDKVSLSKGGGGEDKRGKKDGRTSRWSRRFLPLIYRVTRSLQSSELMGDGSGSSGGVRPWVRSTSATDAGTLARQRGRACGVAHPS